jgi:tetratricopeptide (TPR) repeat protein
MMATINCAPRTTLARQRLPGRHPNCRRPWVGLFTVALLATPSLLAGVDPIQTPLPVGVERAFSAAREKSEKETTNAVAAWQFGRAAFNWADLASSNARREAVARQGVAACRHAIEIDPKSAPAHYYLAFNLGQIARTKLLGALKLVEEMEKEFLTAIELDAAFDHAGPHRSLGALYLDAPGWPASVGNKAKAREHLEKAAALAPDFPANRLAFLEACLKWGEQGKVQNQLASVETMLQAARLKLTGEQWASDWLDWERSWRDIKARVEGSRRKSEAPRQKS